MALETRADAQERDETPAIHSVMPKESLGSEKSLVRLLESILAELPADARILDAGGWFRPLAAATHVVDIMPYQTRQGRLQLEPLPGERFTAATWHIADFLDPQLRLPYPDRTFDFAYCGQTVEDLVDPEPLLRELGRVSRRGLIESPSRLLEQTIGVRDRIGPGIGHPHHHWLLDGGDGHLDLSPKSALHSLAPRQYAIPLLTYARLLAADGDRCTCRVEWKDRLTWALVPADEAAQRACAFRAAVRPPTRERMLDASIRRLRGFKRRLRGKRTDDPAAWWAEMVRMSEPYLSANPSFPRR